MFFFQQTNTNSFKNNSHHGYSNLATRSSNTRVVHNSIVLIIAFFSGFHVHLVVFYLIEFYFLVRSVDENIFVCFQTIYCWKQIAPDNLACQCNLCYCTISQFRTHTFSFLLCLKPGDFTLSNAKQFCYKWLTVLSFLYFTLSKARRFCLFYNAECYDKIS